MTSLIQRLKSSPYAEVAARQAYWRIPTLHARIRARSSSKQPTESPASTREFVAQDLIDLLSACGVESGDMVIVHSRDAALADLGVNPRIMNDALISHLGPSGTLALPAFARNKGEPTGLDWMHERAHLPTIRFDVKRSRPITGLLGWDLSRRAEAVRSRFPINNLVAIGASADMMFAAELDDPLPTACGPNSGWAYAWRRNAKVVMLGVDVAHTLTMNHVSEDSFEGEWPIRHWYRQRDAVITDASGDHAVRIRERRPKWAMHYAEGKLNSDLRAAGIIRDAQLGGVSIAVLSAREHIDFLASRRSNAYPYYLIPKGDWK